MGGLQLPVDQAATCVVVDRSSHGGAKPQRKLSWMLAAVCHSIGPYLCTLIQWLTGTSWHDRVGESHL